MVGGSVDQKPSSLNSTFLLSISFFKKKKKQEHRRALAQLPCRIAAPVSDEEFARSPWAPSWWKEWRENASSDRLPHFASRASAFAAAAAAEALADAGIDFGESGGGGGDVDPSRVAVSIGVGMPAVKAAALAGGELFSKGGGGKAAAEEEEEENPPLLSAPTSRLLRDSALASGPSSLLAASLGLNGPLFAPSTACAAGASAVADAFEAVASGRADVALAGGSEACVDAVTLAAFSRMRALCGDSNGADEAPWASRPFGKGRSGFVVGEGAGVLVLEAAETAAKRRRRRKRGRGGEGRRSKANGDSPAIAAAAAAVSAYCELRGAGVSADAHHAAQPREGGPGAAEAMRLALRLSGLEAREVSHVSAHATSTPAGDAAEASALASVFSRSSSSLPSGAKSPAVVVSGVKAAIGHLLGAAGAVEAALAVVALADARAPPTATLSTNGGEEDEGEEGEEEAGKRRRRKRSRVGVEEKGFEIARAVEGGVPFSYPSFLSSSGSSSSSSDTTTTNSSSNNSRRGLVALSNSFGFGGANVCLAFSSPPGGGVRARRWRGDEGEGGVK